jgi:hypothetical protein
MQFPSRCFSKLSRNEPPWLHIVLQLFSVFIFQINKFFSTASLIVILFKVPLLGPDGLKKRSMIVAVDLELNIERKERRLKTLGLRNRLSTTGVIGNE